MLKKSVIVATALFASIVAFQPVEQAEAKVHIGIGIGVPGFYGPGYGPGYYGGGYYGHRHGYRPHYGYRMSCGKARRKIRHRGFYRIRAVDCSGSRYTFKAKRHGSWYKIRLNSRSGRIIRIRHL